MTVSTRSDWATVAQLIDQFEDARRESLEHSLEEFLPPTDHPLYNEVAAELVRVDLEYQWQAGIHKSIESYRQDVPSLFVEPELLASAAYEEYRQRRLAGETASPEEYAQRYKIVTHDWPEDACPSEDIESEITAAEGATYPEPGNSFAGFKLVEEIGRGAFSRVYLAKQDDLAHRQVVLKVTASRSLEPQHLARLQHTNIVPIYSIHEANSLYAICMPYFGDRTLADLIQAASSNAVLPASGREFLETVAVKRDETIKINSVADTVSEPHLQNASIGKALDVPISELNYVDLVLALVVDVAAGLSHAHQMGIVHRDIKPANILVTVDGRPMLLDFNLSNDHAVGGKTSFTAGGTLPYMGPEHLRAIQTGSPLTPQSDIYSLGVILFELLAGKRPFGDPQGNLDDAIDAMIVERNGKVPAIRQHNSSIAPAVESMVSKCLSPSLNDRYRSAEELHQDLRRHADNLPLLHAPNTSVLERLNKWRRRHPRLMSTSSVSAAAVLLVTLFGLLLASQSRRVAQLEAETHYQEFLDQLPHSRLALSLPGTEAELLRQGIQKGTSTVALYSPGSSEEWRKHERVSLLKREKQQSLASELMELCYLLARGEKILSQQAVSNGATKVHIERALKFNQQATKCLEPGRTSAALISQRKSLQNRANKEVADRPDSKDRTSSGIEVYLESQQLVELQQYKQAKPKLDTLRKEYPTDPVVWLLAGNTEAGLGREFAAEGCYTTAIALQPKSYVGYYNRGLCRIDLKDFEGALADFAEVLKLKPELQCALLNRAIAHEATGQYDKALQDIDKAMANGGFPSRAYFLRARLRSRLGDSEGTKRDLAAGLAEPPTDELGWIARGIARLKGDPKGALDDFQTALQLNPNSTSALKNIVHVTADRLDKPQEAAKAFKQWLAINPNDAAALVGQAVLNARLGDRDAALSSVGSALKMSKEPVVLFQAACALSLTAKSDNGDAARGLLLLSRSTELDPRLLARVGSDPDLAGIRKLPEYSKLSEVRRELHLLQQSLKKAGERSP